MRIIIETIPHDEQRYPTTGDWGAGYQAGGYGGEVESYFAGQGGDILVRVSDMGDWRYEALVGIHEAIEAVLCKYRNVDEASVTAFDKRFEAAREYLEAIPEDRRQGTSWAGHSSEIMQALTDNIDAEPGDCAEAPYYHEHQVATGVERIMAAYMNVNWNAYEAANLALYEDGK